MKNIMLIEIWERMRGYDKWTPVEAMILSSKLDDVEVADMPQRYGGGKIYEWQSTCVISWKDSNGKEHKTGFEVSENSPLFQLYDGQTVTIRYNPANPDEFYQRGVAESNLMATLKWKVGPALVGLMLLLTWVFRMLLR